MHSWYFLWKICKKLSVVFRWLFELQRHLQMPAMQNWIFLLGSFEVLRWNLRGWKTILFAMWWRKQCERRRMLIRLQDRTRIHMQWGKSKQQGYLCEIQAIKDWTDPNRSNPLIRQNINEHKAKLSANEFNPQCQRMRPILRQNLVNQAGRRLKEFPLDCHKVHKGQQFFVQRLDWLWPGTNCAIYCIGLYKQGNARKIFLRNWH